MRRGQLARKMGMEIVDTDTDSDTVKETSASRERSIKIPDTKLHHAITSGNVDAVRSMLDSGWRLDGETLTPLHTASLGLDLGVTVVRSAFVLCHICCCCCCPLHLSLVASPPSWSGGRACASAEPPRRRAAAFGAPQLGGPRNRNRGRERHPTTEPSPPRTGAAGLRPRNEPAQAEQELIRNCIRCEQ